MTEALRKLLVGHGLRATVHCLAELCEEEREAAVAHDRIVDAAEWNAARLMLEIVLKRLGDPKGVTA